MQRNILGRKGEEMAQQYLLRQKYKIIGKNYRCRYGEIDLIAEKKGAITFVEVKYRSTLEFGFPQESVIKRKKEKIKKVAMNYLKEHNLWDRIDCHFDVLSIYTKGEQIIVEHIKDAF